MLSFAVSIRRLAGPRKGTFTACIAQARPNNLTSAAQAAGHPFHTVTTAWHNTLLERLWPARYTDNRHHYSDGHPGRSLTRREAISATR